MSNILIADGNRRLGNALKDYLEDEGHRVDAVTDGNSAVRILHEKYFDLLITELNLSDLNGITLLKKTKQISPATAVIVSTAYGSMDDAVKAIREGASDYITKPFSIEEMELKIEKVLEKERLTTENVLLKECIEKNYGEIIGNSREMKQIYSLIDKVAPTDAPVLILGQSGTGKELVAHEIHKRSLRADGPFVAVCCAAIAATLLESEMFGHEKGSFTGAIARKRGKLEVADGGTLFLDEIGELSIETQVKILRFLQEKEFERVGGTETIKVSVRIIAATNADLEKRIEEGLFREDLFYRINTFPITLPPLKDRKGDIPELARHFLLKYGKELHKDIGISPEAIGILNGYEWPGNVRELENVIARAAILAEGGVILPRNLKGLVKEIDQVDFEKAGKKSTLGSKMDAIESEVIIKALFDNEWNVSRAAKLLGMKRTSLQYKMRRYNIQPPRKRRRAKS